MIRNSPTPPVYRTETQRGLMPTTASVLTCLGIYNDQCAFYFMPISTCKITLVPHSRSHSVANGSTPQHSLPCMLYVRIPPPLALLLLFRYILRNGASMKHNGSTLYSPLSWCPMDQPIRLRLLHRLRPPPPRHLHLHYHHHRFLLLVLRLRSRLMSLVQWFLLTLRAKVNIGVKNSVSGSYIPRQHTLRERHTPTNP